MESYDLIVVGGGPGGYVGAIRAAQLGLRVVCIDENAQLGGVCLRVGCIPSKAVLESSEQYDHAAHGLAAHGVLAADVALDLPALLRRKERIVAGLAQGVAGLLKKNGITRIEGRARLLGSGQVAVAAQVLRATSILLATGSKPAGLPGVAVDGQRIVSSDGALEFAQVPKHLIVIGGGYIGLEMASVWLRLGAQVTVLEYLDRILAGSDEQIARSALAIFQKQGMRFHLGSKVQSARVEGQSCIVAREGAQDVTGDRVLLAVGRVPASGELGLEQAGVETDAKGFVRVDRRYASSAAGIFAVGDLIGGAMLAHKAEEEAVACVEGIGAGRCHVNYQAIPSVVYTHPEIAAVGMTEQELKQAGVEYRVGAFPFSANGRARTLEDTQGFVKVLADAASDRLLGVHILGPRAGDLIAEAALAIALGATSQTLGRMCHPHPSLSEALKEAALAVQKQAIQI